MQDVQITANLSASLVDQLLPESEGFQMLQSISIETKIKNTYSRLHQTFNWTVRQLLLPEYFHYCQQRDGVCLLFQTQLQFEKISNKLRPHVYTSSSIFWLVKMCWQKNIHTYIFAFSQLFAEKYLSECYTSSLLHCFCNIVRIQYCSDKMIIQVKMLLLITLLKTLITCSSSSQCHLPVPETSGWGFHYKTVKADNGQNIKLYDRSCTLFRH